MKKLQTTLDKITTLISAILCAAMMVILFAALFAAAFLCKKLPHLAFPVQQLFVFLWGE